MLLRTTHYALGLFKIPLPQVEVYARFYALRIRSFQDTPPTDDGVGIGADGGGGKWCVRADGIVSAQR